MFTTEIATGPKKFVIITSQRSGSIYLRVSLNNCADVMCYGEVLNRLHPGRDSFIEYCAANHPGWSPLVGLSYRAPLYQFNTQLFPRVLLDEFLGALFSGQLGEPWVMEGVADRPENDERVRSIGFKLMYRQAQRFASVRHCLGSSEVAKIHLIRRNWLQQFISTQRLWKSGRAFSIDDSGRDRRVTVVPRLFWRYVESMQGCIDEVRSTYGRDKKSFLELHYEDIFSSSEVEECRLLGFIGSGSHAIPRSKTRKMRSDVLADEVTNAADVIQMLENTPLRHFLDDYIL